MDEVRPALSWTIRSCTQLPPSFHRPGQLDADKLSANYSSWKSFLPAWRLDIVVPSSDGCNAASESLVLCGFASSFPEALLPLGILGVRRTSSRWTPFMQQKAEYIPTGPPFSLRRSHWLRSCAVEVSSDEFIRRDHSVSRRRLSICQRICVDGHPLKDDLFVPRPVFLVHADALHLLEGAALFSAINDPSKHRVLAI